MLHHEPVDCHAVFQSQTQLYRSELMKQRITTGTETGARFSKVPMSDLGIRFS